jgi:protein-glutamine gamma-glutamyltransferase
VRFRTIHKVVAYIVAGLGMLSLAIGGVLHPALVAAAAVAMVASWWAEEPLIARPAYSRAWTASMIVVLIAQIVRVALSWSFIECAIEFALVLQLSRLWNRRGAREYQQIVVLALVHVIAASVLDQDVSYAAVYAGVVVAIPWALTLSHLRREIEGNYRRSEPEAQRAHVNRILNSRRIVSPRFLWVTTLLTLPVFALSGLLFLLFPRVGLGFIAGGPQRRITVAGFSDSVELGDVGVVRNDSTVEMRVEIDPLPTPPPRRLAVHWRGAAYDHYDGRRWTRSRGLDRREPAERVGDRYCLSRACGVRSRRTTYRIFLEDLDPPVLLIPPGAADVLMPPVVRGSDVVHRELSLSPLGEMRREREPMRVVHYEVESPLPPPQAFLEARERDLSPYLQVPPLDPRVADLAKRVTTAATEDVKDHPLRAAAAVVRHLQSSYRYTLDLRGTSNERPLEDFLFRRRSGHCEFFATAMAVMLRTVGVPTRNVTGFVGGRLNPYGGDGVFYSVTQSDAHSWVEVYAPDHGWVAFDPTPPAPAARLRERTLSTIMAELYDATQLAWDKNVVAYDLERQIDVLSSAYFATRRWRHAWRHRNDGEVADRRTGRSRASAGTAIPIAAAVVALGAAAVVLWRRRQRRTGARRGGRRDARLALASELLRRLDGRLARAGAARPPWCTPLEHAEALAAQSHPDAEIAGRVVARYNEVRFGAGSFAEGELDALYTAIRQVGARPAHTERRSGAI